MKNASTVNRFSQALSRRDFLSSSLKAGAAAFTTSLIPKLHASNRQRHNVLLIIVDDLRPLLGAYGHTAMHTPNIDRIAQRGTLFNKAYCQFPLCSPSRTTIMTGLRPDTTQVDNNQVFFRETTPNAVTLPQHFKVHGYHTQSIGKVAHIPKFQDDDFSWSVPSWRPLWTAYDAATTPSWQAFDVDDDEFRDGKTARRTVQVLNEIRDEMFFLAVGFYKPHLPYHAPKKYFDLYENETFNLPAISENVTPEIIPPNWNAIRTFEDVPSGLNPIPYDKILELTRAYAAVTSYTDAQIGRVLNQLDALGLTENTVIAFCGDHGYNLAENGNWGKNIVYEATLRSPLIVSVPGQNVPGSQTDALVEFVDIFPTLSDACKLPILPELEGISMIPVMEQPSLPWKTAAFSQHKQIRSIRTDRYRYTETRRLKELYDYATDPHSEENIAENPENTHLVAQLSEQLEAGWKNALPENADRYKSPHTLLWDINNDGIVDMEDLIIISNSFRKEIWDYPKADVNLDGCINIIDLLIVAAHLGETTNPSAPKKDSILTPTHAQNITNWIDEAHQIDDGSVVFRNGISVLENLLDTITPQKTTLLQNYPNPFNPETWIPYDLAQDAQVDIEIYNLQGKIIRKLNIGFQNAGTYRTRGRAAYWDGQNSDGELVASGLYFYVLNTGKTRSICQMTILK